MKKTSTFQTIILVVFGAFIVIGMAYFSLGAGSGKKDSSKLRNNITIWGTLPDSIIMNTMHDIFPKNSGKIIYKQKRKNVFNKDLIDALASGKGPDMILLPQNLILQYSDKIYPVPYKSMSVRDFKNRFIQEGELYLNKTGILAMPITINPMVMYWNRNIFSSSGISEPPKYWDEFYKIAQNVTVKDNQSNISQSAVALGGFQNITHAKDILSLLIMQAGDPITAKSTLAKSGVVSVFGGMFGGKIPPAVSALYFYTGFSNPIKSNYSWNSSLPDSFDMFTKGNLAVYFGFASEVSDIEKTNPNLNFDVAKMPQTKGSRTSITFGNMQGLSILKHSKNITEAFKVSIMLSNPEFVAGLAKALNLPPVRRDLLSKKPSDAYMSLFYDSALISKAWLDPSPIDTENIFKNMVNSISSGKQMVSSSIISTGAEIQNLLK